MNPNCYWGFQKILDKHLSLHWSIEAFLHGRKSWRELMTEIS